MVYVSSGYNAEVAEKIITGERSFRSRLAYDVIGLYGEVRAMNETNGGYKRTRSGRVAALKRLKETERERGADKEYLDVFLHEYQLHESLRRRAKSVSQRYDSR